MSENVYILDVSIEKSSLISKIEYWKDVEILVIFFRKYYTEKLLYQVPPFEVGKLIHSESLGSYYLKHIKPNFKQVNLPKMSEKKQPKKINKASDKVRWIDMSINVRDIKREWIIPGEKGDYLHFKLRMLPDGTVDKFGNLGMLVQTIPTSVYKAAEEKEKGSGKKIEGAILGNAAELDWGNFSSEGAPGDTSQELPTTPIDDLPF